MVYISRFMFRCWFKTVYKGDKLEIPLTCGFYDGPIITIESFYEQMKDLVYYEDENDFDKFIFEIIHDEYGCDGYTLQDYLDESSDVRPMLLTFSTIDEYIGHKSRNGKPIFRNDILCYKGNYYKVTYGNIHGYHGAPIDKDGDILYGFNFGDAYHLNDLH